MSDSWYKVDNVAKVFLATASMRDPRVFRISCTLQEQVDPDTLNEALRRTAQEWPQFQVTLHRGLFWHYFESTDLMPAAQPETKAPCAPLYTPERRNRLIYRVTYFGARINLEMFHAITDGNGGLLYLKSIVRNYLALRHPGELDSVPSPNSASAGDLAQDSFRNFYGGTRRRKAEKKTKVYRPHGFLPYDQLQFFEGHLSARQVLDRSHALGVSMTSYLGACFMLAIYHDMPALERSKPISISLPVNLRNYYPSETARNFFNSVYVTHTLTEADTLETVAPVFDAKLKEVLRSENIRAQMDEYEKLEHVPAIRPVPLFLKNATVKLFTKLEDRHVTAVVSNMGRITIPAELQPYIRSFAAFSSCKTLFTVVCSYGDDLVLGTASALRSTTILQRFYRSLAKDGLDVTLYATEVEKGSAGTALTARCARTACRARRRQLISRRLRRASTAPRSCIRSLLFCCRPWWWWPGRLISCCWTTRPTAISACCWPSGLWQRCGCCAPSCAGATTARARSSTCCCSSRRCSSLPTGSTATQATALIWSCRSSAALPWGATSCLPFCAADSRQMRWSICS